MNTQDDFYRQLLDQVNNGVYFVDRQRRITYWNKKAEDISGFSADEVMGRFCGDNILTHSDEQGRILCKDGCPLQGCMVDGKRCDAEVFLKHKQGVRIPISIYAVPLRDESGEIVGAVEIFEDMRPQRHLEKTIEELSHEVYLDPVSRALTRRSMEGFLHTRWRRYLRGGNNMGVVFVDMDSLKSINDANGHAAGDKAILHLAHTLMNATREDDTVARWGGDEFVVLLDVDNTEKLTGIVDKFDGLLRSTHVTYKGNRIAVTASFGSALFSEVESLEELIEVADRRMYSSKVD